MSFFKMDNAVIKKMAILQEFRISSKNSRSFYKNSSSLEGRTGKVGSLFVNPLYVLPLWGAYSPFGSTKIQQNS